MVVYHGTDAEFYEFNVQNKRTKRLNFGNGIYLTPNKNLAKMYSNIDKVMKLYAVLNNPYTFYSHRLE